MEGQDYNFLFLFVLLAGWIYAEFFKLEKDMQFLKNLAFISFAIPVLAILAKAQADTIFRFSYYFLIYLPILLSTHQINRQFDTILKNILCRFLMPILFLLTLVLSGEKNKIVPYQTFINL